MEQLETVARMARGSVAAGLAEHAVPSHAARPQRDLVARTPGGFVIQG